jgi:hypothetical protein
MSQKRDYQWEERFKVVWTGILTHSEYPSTVTCVEAKELIGTSIWNNRRISNGEIISEIMSISQ